MGAAEHSTRTPRAPHIYANTSQGTLFLCTLQASLFTSSRKP